MEKKGRTVEEHFSKGVKHRLKLGRQRMEVNTHRNRAERSLSVLGNI